MNEDMLDRVAERITGKVGYLIEEGVQDFMIKARNQDPSYDELRDVYDQLSMRVYEFLA